MNKKLKKLKKVSQENDFKFIQGQPGDPGQPGPPGKNGDSLTWDQLTESQKEQIKGRPGVPGDPLTWDDLTEDQKVSLQGKKGKDFTWNDLTESQKEELRPIVDHELIKAGVLSDLEQHEKPLNPEDLPRVVLQIKFKTFKNTITQMNVIYTSGPPSGWLKVGDTKIQHITNTGGGGGGGGGGLNTVELTKYSWAKLA